MYQHLSCSICSKGQWWEMMVIRCHGNRTVVLSKVAATQGNRFPYHFGSSWPALGPL